MNTKFVYPADIGYILHIMGPNFSLHLIDKQHTQETRMPSTQLPPNPPSSAGRATRSSATNKEGASTYITSQQLKEQAARKRAASKKK